MMPVTWVRFLRFNSLSLRTFVAGVIQIDKILFPITRKRRGVYSISVILTRNVAFSCCEVKCWDVVRSVAIFELDGAGASCQCNQLMTETNAHDRDLGRLHNFTKVIYRVLTMGRVTRPIADENAVETVRFVFRT